MRALFVFCEGNHDVLFTQRCMGALDSCRFFEGSIRDLPTPLGDVKVEHDGDKSFIARRIARHRVGESSLQTAAYPESPVFQSVLTASDIIVVLLRTHGDSAARANIELIRELDEVLALPGRDIEEFAVAFLFDADESLDDRVGRFRREYAEILGSDSSTIDHDQWIRGAIGAAGIGLHVFHDPRRRAGTLDEELVRLVRQHFPSKESASRKFIDETKGPRDPVSKSEANRCKAIVTAVGQFSHPGAPMSRILGDRELLPRAVFAESRFGQDLVAFLRRAPGLQAASRAR